MTLPEEMKRRDETDKFWRFLKSVILRDDAIDSLNSQCSWIWGRIFRKYFKLNEDIRVWI